MARWKCTLYKQDKKNSSADNMCSIFEDSYVLWIILILHPGHSSLFLETVTIKFGSPRARRAEGREKQIPSIPTIFSKALLNRCLTWS